MLRIVIVTLLLALPGFALAQLPNLQLDVNGTQIYTENDRIDDPRGIGFTLAKRIAPKAFLKIEFDRFAKNTSSTLRVYEDYPSTDFTFVPFDIRHHLWSVEVAILRTISYSNYTFFNIGGGFVFAGLDQNRQNEVDLRNYDFDTGHYIGVVIEMDVLIVASDNFPAALRFGFAHKFLTHPSMETSIAVPDIGPSGSSWVPDNLTTTEFSLSIGWVISK
ncbi:MAG: hypothetical protein WBP29_08475 [Candidatus Zixiibacteriota bacterium]